MNTDLQYVTATEHELNELVQGRLAGAAISWPSGFAKQRVRVGTIGVLFRESPNGVGKFVQPLALIVHPEDTRRLFGRFAQLRSDLSPLSAWCHVLSPQWLDRLETLKRIPTHSGFEAAWTGLAVAEALLLAERSIARLKIAGCFATQTFAIARALGLWENIRVDEILNKYDLAQRLIRKNDSGSRLRNRFEPIWSALASAARGRQPVGNESIVLVECLQILQRARESKEVGEAEQLQLALSEIPQAELLRHLPKLTPEARVGEFDRVVSMLEDGGVGGPSRGQQQLLLFLAGYLATIAAGGAPSLTLAEDVARRWPEITAWAYVIGSIGERVIWTSSFDGLGRLVAREIMRPFRLDEAPTCDFALDEAEALIDRQLSDPLVHLKIKQLRFVSVTIIPGVNVPVSLTETPEDVRRTERVDRSLLGSIPSAGAQELLAELAEALWPHLRPLLQDNNSETTSSGQRRSKKQRRFGGQAKLPLVR